MAEPLRPTLVKKTPISCYPQTGGGGGGGGDALTAQDGTNQLIAALKGLSIGGSKQQVSEKGEKTGPN